MKMRKTLILCLGLATTLGLVSCSEDEGGVSYSPNPIENTVLKDILVQKGYQFDANGKLLLDDLANNTTTLDLSGTQISTDALSELSILPNLKEVDLSENGYGPAFDFAKLPEQITGVDLTGNEIYDYNNLINVVIEDNGDEIVTNLLNISKLYLPEEAKYNCTDLMRFYRQNKDAIMSGSIDMQMMNDNGTLQNYTTLRDVPDATLRTTLQTSFSGLFEGEQIDLCNYLPLEQRTVGIQIMNNISNFEGLQYLIQNPSWQGSSITIYSLASDAKVPYFKPSSNVNILYIMNVDMSEGMDLSEATSMRMITMGSVKGLTSIDLSHSTVFGQRGLDVEGDPFTGSGLLAIDSPDLEEILLPSASALHASTVDIECLPSLKTFDLTKFAGINNLTIGDLPDNYNLVYPTLVDFSSTNNNMTNFACSQDTWEKEITKDFVKAYYKDADPKKLGISVNLSSTNNVGTTAAFWW